MSNQGVAGYEPGTPENEVLLDVLTRAVEPTALEAGTVGSVVVPRSASLVIINSESQLDKPKRKRGRVQFWDALSMAKYVNDHKSSATVLYTDDQDATVLAVLNDHTTTDAGWGDHCATLKLRATKSWQRWRSLDNKLMPLSELAEHIERHLIDIVDPDGTTLLELAQTFQATTTVDFKESRLVDNGQRQFQYTENIEAKGGSRGDLTIPKEFTLGIAPFENTEPYKVTARLRYLLREGRLTIGYVLINPEDIEREAFRDVVESVGDATTLQALYGEVVETFSAPIISDRSES